MRFFFLLLFVGMLFSCDDGDLQIETIDFDNAGIQFCESETNVNSTIFFKLNTSEALILELQSGVLKNEVSDGQLKSSVPGQSQITYRSFLETFSEKLR